MKKEELKINKLHLSNLTRLLLILLSSSQLTGVPLVCSHYPCYFAFPSIAILLHHVNHILIGKEFMPKLKEFYDEINKDGKKLEVIYVSCDNAREGFESHFKEMSWPAIPF
jgi:hypothetical protein